MHFFYCYFWAVTWVHSPQPTLPKLWMFSLTFVLCDTGVTCLWQHAAVKPASDLQLWCQPSVHHNIDCSPHDSFSGLHVSAWRLSINAFCFSFPYSKSFLSFPTLKIFLQTVSNCYWTRPHLEGLQQHKCFAPTYHGFSSLWLLPLIQPPNVPSRLCASGCGRCVSHPPWSLSPMSCGGKPGHVLLDDLVVSWI